MPFLAFDWSGWVVPASLRLVAPLGSSGSTTYSGRSFLYVSLNQLTSLRQTTLTMLDLEPWIVLIGHSGNWKLDQRCLWWHNSVTNSDICACVCVKVATQHDSCNNNQRKLGSKPAVILQSWLSFFDCSAAFVPLSVPEVSSTSSMQTNSCTSKVRWGEHFIANVAARFSGDWPDSWSSWNSSEVDTCMTHCWRAQFDQLDSHAVHNPTSMKTLSSTWWWLHH